MWPFCRFSLKAVDPFSSSEGIHGLPLSRVRLLAVLASFDTLLVELPRTLAPRDERHNGQNDNHCDDNQSDHGGRRGPQGPPGRLGR